MKSNIKFQEKIAEEQLNIYVIRRVINQNNKSASHTFVATSKTFNMVSILS